MSYIQSILDNELSLSNHARFLKKHSMYSAALYYKNLNEPIERRAARVSRYHLESMPIPTYMDGQQLIVKHPNWLLTKIPNDDMLDYGLTVNIEGELIYDGNKFMRLKEICNNTVENHIVDSISSDFWSAHSNPNRQRYSHFGMHIIPDIPFVLEHGILAYRDVILNRLEYTTDPNERLFEEGLLEIVDGIEIYMQRYITYLEGIERNFVGDVTALNRLLSAIRRVPLYPAESFYEAFITCNIVMALAKCYETGRIDHMLYPYYERDLAAGKTSPEDAYSLIRELLEDIDLRNGHPGTTHVTIGGSNSDGSAAYNELTEITIRAIGGLRAPNVTLRVRQDMPQSVWDACLYNIGKGYAQPAIVNEELYIERLVRDYDIPYEDAVEYAFGGCSELMIQGKTCCDATWVAYNMLDIFEHTLYNNFLTCKTFEEFLIQFKEDCCITLREMAENINVKQFTWGLHSPNILRSLLIRDCIKNAKSFSNGGARYNFDCTNIYASTNTINSLYTIKQYYDGKLGEFSKETFLKGLISNFSGYEELRSRCLNVTKFGNFEPELNELASDLMDYFFSEIMKLHCYRSNNGYRGRFMPALILWKTWITCGLRVGATPDGRCLGDPTADSCGPMQGTDIEGPTSVMGAAVSLVQEKCAGTCILNLRFDASLFKTKESTSKVQQLLQVYFMQGGSQVQMNVLDTKALLDAMEHPEAHRDIIVRVGGFSDNFVLLKKRIQTEVLKRTAHNI